MLAHTLVLKIEASHNDSSSLLGFSFKVGDGLDLRTVQLDFNHAEGILDLMCIFKVGNSWFPQTLSFQPD